MYYSFFTDGMYLGVASHDNILDVYHVKKGRKKAVCKGNSSYLTHFDWSRDGILIFIVNSCRNNVNIG